MAYNPRVCSQKFALYLYNNNHLQDFSIEKAEARKLYNDDFKNIIKTKLHFRIVFLNILNLLRKQKNLDLLVFNQNRLLKLTRNKDLTTETGVVAKKKTLVSHSFSFNSNKRREESVLSEKECKLCDVHFPNVENYQQHLTENTHAFFEEFNKALKPPQNKKEADLQITVDGSPILNNIILRRDVSKTINLVVKNVTKHPITIVAAESNAIKGTEFKVICPCDLAPMGSLQCSLTVCRKNDGILYFPILFKTQVNNNVHHFSAELVFHTHGEFFDDLHPVVPYKRVSKAVLREYIEEIDSGERPNIFPQRPNKIPLAKYLLPTDVQIVLNAGLKPFNGMTQSQKLQMDYIKDLLNSKEKLHSLNASNYIKLLDMLLYIEEHQMSKDIRDYDRADQVLKPSERGLLELYIPGLAEHRPSVIFADSVFVREQKNSRILFEGCVHQVKESSVLLKFSGRFTNKVFIKNKKFYVNFSFNRYPLKVSHQAVAFARAHNIAHLLFPQKITTTPITHSDVGWISRDIANNPEQQRAVQSILQRTAMPAPYLIFGPPGTGKTMTVAESVKQIYKRTNHRVLICTPSNSAANEVTKRLVGVIPTTDLYRYVAPSFSFNQIPDEIKKYINYPNGSYYYPSMQEFMKYRVLITTLVSAAKLVNSGCPKDHFGYVFIDESGQATESETLIPIAGILSNGDKQGTFSGQIVLAGDPRQLGPIVHSTLASEYGFGISMLERLMDTSEPYKKDGSNKYNSNALTKLLKNYRSHPAIMKPSNELFYEKELQPSGDDLIHAAINWEHLPNPKFPLIFHSVVGIDQREETSPSFFNIQEVQAVVHYLDLLIGCKMQGITIREDHIGIISPYKKQVDKIKRASKKYNNKLTIGSVEQIQGQERLIIIVSTVRSKADFLKFDNKFHLGFLNNPKRFNVAITRAKALLIVIGNPNILQYDQNWRHFITYCKDNNAMVGEKFDFSDVGKKEFVEESALVATEETNLEDGPRFSRGVM